MCNIQWAQGHLQYIVSTWICHSIVISGQHYANSIPEEAFDRAAGKVPSQQTTQIPTQHAAE